MSDSKVATVDFGAPEAFGAHAFRVEITAARTDPIKIIEDFGFKGGTGGIPYEECRVIVPRAAWAAISDHARRDFNERLKVVKASTGRWKTGKTLVDRLLGKELCVLAWAAERAHADELPIICSKWGALRPEERWWLFSVTAAEAGLADDVERGWRKAIYYALADGERITTDKKVRRRPKDDDSPTLFEVKR